MFTIWGAPCIANAANACESSFQTHEALRPCARVQIVEGRLLHWALAYAGGGGGGEMQTPHAAPHFRRVFRFPHLFLATLRLHLLHVRESKHGSLFKL